MITTFESKNSAADGSSFFENSSKLRGPAMTTKTTLGTLLLIFFATVAFAQVPQTMSYQGVLTDTQGNAVSETAHTP